MRFSPFSASFARLALLPCVGLVGLVSPLVVTACSASGAGTAVPVDTSVAPAEPLPPADAAGPIDASDAGADVADTAPMAPKNDCKLSDLQGVADVTPQFVIYAPPTTAPPMMTGGTLQGQYIVDGATVFLPSGSAGLVDTRTSSGKVNAWAVFSGTNYRLHLKVDLDLATVAGPQVQGTDSSSQGAFTATGPTLLIDHACDTAIAQEADYSFTDMGGGRATILIKTPSPYGDTYLELDASKN